MNNCTQNNRYISYFLHLTIFDYVLAAVSKILRCYMQVKIAIPQCGKNEWIMKQVGAVFGFQAANIK